MLKRIVSDGITYATIITDKFPPIFGNNVFVTNIRDSFQIGFLRYEFGHIVKPHRHPPQQRHISHTTEVLIVRKGSMLLSIYTKEEVLITNEICNEGDVIILTEQCGHSIVFREKTELIEIKQGPYDPAKDKVYFSSGKENG